MAFSDKLLGNNRENIPNWAFLLMTLVMKVMDIMGLSIHRTVLSNGYSCSVDDHTADVVLVLGMFYMIQNINALLCDFSRIVRFSGIVIIEDGHQSREQTKTKILKGGYLKIELGTTGHVRCLPL